MSEAPEGVNAWITNNFKLVEFLQSDTADRLGIDLLHPPQEILNNIKKSAIKAQEARTILGVPITISNCWRPLELNRAIGSKDSSAHVQGLGVDMIPHGMTIADAFDKLRKHHTFMVDIDQMIIERGCIHIGLLVPGRHPEPRRELRTEVLTYGERHYPLLAIWPQNA